MYRYYNGKKYGIVPRRSSIWETIFVNLPLINRFYTIKVEVNVVSRLKDGALCHGLLETFRIFKNQNTILFNFIPYDPIENPYKYAEKILGRDNSVTISKEFMTDIIYSPGREVEASLVRDDIDYK